jgi:predicted ATPase/DNA-binding XRE family transcriptional regulator
MNSRLYLPANIGICSYSLVIRTGTEIRTISGGFPPSPKVVVEAHSFGPWLRLKRKALDLSRGALAERVGCSAATIQKLEEEERRPSIQMAERLATILKVPTPEHAAFLRFARGEGHLAPAHAAEDFPWRRSTLPTRSNLPAPVTSLIGREQQVEEVRGLLFRPDRRLVTLVGPPGIGKTQLSIEAARTLLPDFPEGIFFVALAPLDDSAFIAQTAAHALGLVGARQASTQEQLVQSIGERHILIVLDNCEHLVESVAALVRYLLDNCPRLRLLTTSRESLRIPGEWQYPVPALACPEPCSPVNLDTALTFPALALFAQRAQAVRATFTLDAENVQSVASLCARLDGLPLGIELIAARMRLMSPQELLGRLNDPLLLSMDGLRLAGPRQQTLSDAIRWSYNLLSGEEQRVFAYISVLSGAFTLGTVEALFAQRVQQRSVADHIRSLLDKSLIQRARSAAAETHFVLLAVLQEFGRERLRESGEETEVRNAHLAFFLNLVDQADQNLRGPQQAEWLQRLNQVRDNLRAALEWALANRQAEAALLLISKLHWFWLVRSDHNEARQWFGRVLDLPETPSHPRLEAQVFAQLAHHVFLQLRPRDARPYADQALAMARAQHDNHNTAWALLMVGLALTGEKEFEAALPALEESRALFHQERDEWSYAIAVLALGWAAYGQQNWSRSLALMEEALAVFRRLGDGYLTSVSLGQIGAAHLNHGSLRQAEAALQEALVRAQQLDSKYEIASDLWRLGEAAQAAQRWTRASRFYAAARSRFEGIGAWQSEDDARLENFLAACRAALGDTPLDAALEAGRSMTLEQAVTYAADQSTDSV